MQTTGVTSAVRLDGSLLVGGDHILVGAQAHRGDVFCPALIMPARQQQSDRHGRRRAVSSVPLFRIKYTAGEQLLFRAIHASEKISGTLNFWGLPAQLERTRVLSANSVAGSCAVPPRHMSLDACLPNEAAGNALFCR
jgi:hypothetical protein